MILGIEIRNFDIFDSDKAGILIEDFIEKKDGGKSYNSLRGLNAFIGRNNTGKMTVRHQGGGTKRQYRIIDFKRKLTVLLCLCEMLTVCDDDSCKLLLA